LDFKINGVSPAARGLTPLWNLEVEITIPCSSDLTLASTKYFYALEEGEVPLLFLFSGTIFYAGADGRLQVEQISWNKEAMYRLPVSVWREMMETHYPNCAWLYLNRETSASANGM
jgi:hypothetical protein